MPDLAADHFFIVLRDDDARLYRHRDDTDEAAVKEAQRLALVAPGHTFFVLKAIKAAKFEPVPVIETTTPIPF